MLDGGSVLADTEASPAPVKTSVTALDPLENATGWNDSVDAVRAVDSMPHSPRFRVSFPALGIVENGASRRAARRSTALLSCKIRGPAGCRNALTRSSPPGGYRYHRQRDIAAHHSPGIGRCGYSLGVMCKRVRGGALSGAGGCSG